ncbi:Brix-domain-containing protein [Sistotremastrum suecicum HHB10207 ss-3]|uniref:Brix-domain-containing protein n=1 Tax=Sistotremastrum suecicum HHB10207 ss-3 TaxID=1314776 RepID=A0A166GTI4_9AGAM|nr:Brix-domain-containing protein [Sistotremastrum suecicum HHB10207 ss-3]
MARRRKTRTHKQPVDGEGDGLPKSFVVRHGQVGESVTQLVRDIRKVMEPNTASRLKERSRNKLKDYLTIAPSLHVTHLLAFTLTPIAPSFRIVRLSAGPTLTFRVERYSLAKDILNVSKRARSMGLEYLTPPLLVCASFPPPSPSTPPQIPLLLKAFQSMFPPLSPQTLTLSAARRVVLITYNAEKGTIDWRHYLITVRPYGVSKRVRRVVEGITKGSSKSSEMLNLANEKDIADFVLRKRGEKDPAGEDEGYETAASSASSAGGDDPEAAVDLADNYVGRNNEKGSRRAVKLDEIGPRMELRLLKITEGVPGKEGGVLFHEFIKRSKKEIARQKAEHAERAKIKKQRQDEQARNVARKKKLASKDGKGDDDELDEDEGEDEPEVDLADDDDDEDAWDEDEDVVGSEDEDAGEDEDSESEPEARPLKKVKHTRNR